MGNNVRPWDPKSPAKKSGTGPGVPVAPTVTALSPNTAVVGGPDVTMVVTGTGFTAQSIIVFNGGDEPTTYVNPTQVTTLVRPSTASGPFTVPINVRNGALTSNAVNFSFTAPAGP